MNANLKKFLINGAHTCNAMIGIIGGTVVTTAGATQVKQHQKGAMRTLAIGIGMLAAGTVGFVAGNNAASEAIVDMAMDHPEIEPEDDDFESFTGFNPEVIKFDKFDRKAEQPGSEDYAGL